MGRGVHLGAYEVAGAHRSPRALRPQLGLGAVTRQPTTKARILMTGQRSASPLSHAASMGQPTHCFQESTGQLALVLNRTKADCSSASRSHIVLFFEDICRDNGTNSNTTRCYILGLYYSVYCNSSPLGSLFSIQQTVYLLILLQISSEGTITCCSSVRKANIVTQSHQVSL